MPYNSHILNSTHSHIIGRTDSITGDAVKENDRIVFCAVCKSCFLEESWKYMNEQHCEQNQTLDAVPALPSTLVVKRQGEELLAVLNDDKNFTKNSNSFILNGLLLTLPLTQLFEELSDNFSISLLLSIILGFSLAFFIGKPKQIKRGEKDIYLFEDKLDIERVFFYWKDIKQIQFERKMGDYTTRYLSKTPTLSIYLKDGTKQVRILPTKDYISIDLFLKGLAKISNYTEVVFYTEHPQEYENSKKIKKNTKGHLLIKEPTRLLTDSDYPHQF
ncbi:hypothetical protein ACE193_02630 [Bernardetia sp. OM2101]|uniref:hypothetical protein n=1 Tax=Bernardetia sp. OM2101 TaxID=3344876 RepID=UPI0035D1269C